MPRTKQTARREDYVASPEMLLKRQRQREETRAKKERDRLARQIHVTFDSETVLEYFKPTAATGTFRHCIQDKIRQGVQDNLIELDWEFKGDKQKLLKTLKTALGGRLYSRNLLGMWCTEGLATTLPYDGAPEVELI